MDLHVKYRPSKLSEVVGQNAVVKSLGQVIKTGKFHALLFSGPAGVGKTTLARIAADMTGTDPQNVIEIDAATHTGVDAMRGVVESAQFQAFGESNKKFVIVDEVHRLSGQAFDSLLKIIEEPPRHLKWALCTTNVAKVPKTIRTRCVSYVLAPVKFQPLWDLVDDVARAEKINVDDDVLNVVAKQAGGSPRQALINLSAVAGCKTAAEAKEVLRAIDEESDVVIDLCRALVEGRENWAGLMALIQKMTDQSAESVRIVVCAYMSKVVMGAKNDKVATRGLEILDAFSDPYPEQSGNAPLLLSIGRVLFRA